MFYLCLVCVCLFYGCNSPQSCIILSNQTGFGIRASYNPQTQLPEGEIGYINSVFSIIPTNRAFNSDEVQIEKVGGGAKDTANVLFETNFSNWFNFWSDQAIYQRVAVGETAVSQPGVFAIFAKDYDGKIDVELIKALSGLKSETQNVSKLKSLIAKVYTDKKTVIDEILKQMGYSNYDYFIDNENNLDKINKIVSKLKESGININ